MGRSIVSVVLPLLFVSVLSAGCGIRTDEVNETSAGNEPSTTGTPTTAGEDPADVDPPAPDSTEPEPSEIEPSEPTPGDSDEICDHLKVISDADLGLSGASTPDVLREMTRTWPELSEAYDEAIALADVDLAEDLRAVKRVSELMIEAMAGAENEEDMDAALLSLAEDHRDEFLAGDEAAIRANRFTEDECGFSLNHE